MSNWYFLSVSNKRTGLWEHILDGSSAPLSLDVDHVHRITNDGAGTFASFLDGRLIKQTSTGPRSSGHAAFLLHSDWPIHIKRWELSGQISEATRGALRLAWVEHGIAELGFGGLAGSAR